MKKTPAVFPYLSICALAITMAVVPGCGPKEKSPESGPGAAAGEKSGPGAKKAAPVVVVPKPILLKTLAVFEGGELNSISPASISYKARGDLKSLYEFHKKQFLERGWKESADATVTDQYASGTFSGVGHTISVSVTPAGPPGELHVALQHHGDIELAKLPVPPDSKAVYVGPLSAMYVTQDSVPATTETVRDLLLKTGWETHGNEGDSWHFVKERNRVSAMISSAPAQGGKTMINYSCVLLTGELPAPPDAQALRYNNSRQEITFETNAEKDTIFAYYKERLAKTGWKPNREEPYHVDNYDTMVFRTPAGDVGMLRIKAGLEAKQNVSLEYLSAQDMAEMDKRTKEEGERIKEKLAAEKVSEAKGNAGPPKTRVSVTLPAEASGIEKTAGSIKFVVGNGKARAVAEAWRKQFTEAGWKEDAATLDAMAGMISLSKDNGSLTVNYVDTGIIPAVVTISGMGVEFDQK